MPRPGEKIGTMTNEIDVNGAKLYNWTGVLKEQLNPLFTRQFVHGEQAMVAKIFLNKGCVVPLHQHPNEQISMVIGGSMEFVIDGVAQIVRAGDILVIPGNIPHSATALEDFDGLDIFAPPRQDWIDKSDAYLR
jgi:quercetin dioxygenase-like cupin family protein